MYQSTVNPAIARKQKELFPIVLVIQKGKKCPATQLPNVMAAQADLAPLAIKFIYKGHS